MREKEEKQASEKEEKKRKRRKDIYVEFRAPYFSWEKETSFKNAYLWHSANLAWTGKNLNFKREELDSAETAFSASEKIEDG